MKQFYSPFIYKNDSFITLSNIRFSHIAQLKERNIEEGYQVEYKSQWDDNFLKKHLCQVITSFANSEGGWLFIGIENETAEYVGIEKLRADFSQIISQKLTAVSPVPKFECRFIKNPKDVKMGVLIIYIYEGLNPPYICNGTVYLRNGSSKTPIKPGRIELDNLIQKRENFNKQHKEFRINNFYDVNIKSPFCNIYLYNPYTKLNINTITNELRVMMDNLSKTGNWKRLCYSPDSILCYNADVISKNSMTPITEFYVDGNVKISCPLFCLHNDLREDWAHFINEQNSKIDFSEMQVIDGYISFNAIHRGLKDALEYIKKYNYHINNYTISFEYKNVGNTVLYFRTDFNNSEGKTEYIQNIKSNKFYTCQKNKVKTIPFNIIDDVKIENIGGICLQLMDTNFALLFGIDPDDLRQIVKRAIPLYQEKFYSSLYES